MNNISQATILIVDDTEANLEVLAEILGDQYDIMVAQDGSEALERINAEIPDLILLDIMMPGMDGYEVCRRLQAKDETREIPIIFVTAMSEVEDETKGLEIGAVDYITKPISAPVVRARVKTHLRLKTALQDLKHHNEVLNENIRLRDDVERITRHDLKTPLNAVLNVPDLLIQEGNLTGNQVEMLQMLEESGYRILEIVNSSLDLYKMETGSYKLNPVPVDLLKIVNQIGSETRALMKSKGISINLWINEKRPDESDSFTVLGEEMLCYTMLANLTKNAVEASPEWESILISFGNDNPATVQIRNKGTVPIEIRDKFFEKYSSFGKEGGTGLGTYSAKLIAQTLGGDISFESNDENGTTLTVSLPKASEIIPVEEQTPIESAAPIEKTSVAGIDRGINILVADDFQNMRLIIVSILKQMGFKNVTQAENGTDAMLQLESGKFDLIISDWNMPAVTGIELLDYVRTSPDLKDTPFIMLTGEADQDTITEAGKAGVDAYILKPFPADLLKRKIEDIFKKHN